MRLLQERWIIMTQFFRYDMGCFLEAGVACVVFVGTLLAWKTQWICIMLVFRFKSQRLLFSFRQTELLISILLWRGARCSKGRLEQGTLSPGLSLLCRAGRMTLLLSVLYIRFEILSCVCFVFFLSPNTLPAPLLCYIAACSYLFATTFTRLDTVFKRYASVYTTSAALMVTFI